MLTYQSPKYKKFKMDSEYSKANILTFLNDVKEKKIQQIIKSQPIPESQTGSVVEVVALSFKEEVLDSKQDVLVEFYSPTCGFCKKFDPVYSKLGDQLKEKNPNLKLVKIDATTNDIDEYDIDHYPTVFFIPANTKERVEVKNDDLDIVKLVDFLKKTVTFDWVQLPLEEEAAEKPKEEAVEKKEEAPKEGEKVEL